VYPFRVKQLAPSDAKIKIKGNLEFVLKNTEITDSSSSQSATYTIYLVDRAGNKSNSVVTPEITVKK
jgi:hypothetical protein